MLSQDVYETIEAYLAGKLNTTELSDFEAKLQADPDLAREVLLLKEIDLAVGDKSVLQFQELVRKEGEAFKQAQSPRAVPVKRLAPRRYLAVAATLLLLVATVFLLRQYSDSSPSGQNLFAQHFETYNLSQSMRSESVAEEALFQTAIEQYQNENFSAASSSFQQLANNSPDDMVLAFCLANAYLNQSPPALDPAAAQFQKIIADGQSIYVLRSQWYLALIRLEQGDRAAAKKLLQALAQAPDNLGQKASSLLKDLAE